VALESGYHEDCRVELQRRGHALCSEKGGFGGYQAIWRDPATGLYRGASESRKDGHAVAF